ncbi:DALR anticodon-binding domain-containing protein 3 isoform X2 [Ischnura elegans]|nr:DALR anticodon-binding domain-containing protein 3 isoform X2 [Ischnura elegans]
MKESESWLMKIKECSVNCGKIVVKLKRRDVFMEVLRSIHSKGLDFGTLDDRGEVVSLTTDLVPGDSDLSLLRLALTTKVLRRILEKLGYEVCDHPTSKECLYKVLFTINPSVRASNVSTLVCGVVRNILSHKKEVDIDADSYRRMREKDVEQASVHKYGPSVLQPSWKTFLAAVTDSVITVDLLCTKPSQPVSLDLQDKFVLNRERSSKGATFLLYNYARLVSILKQFDEKVSEGIYPPIVPIENADFSLLSLEEEWMLVYCYLMPYPSLLAQLVKPKELKFDIHTLLKYMQDLCKCLSAYYSRVHILTEPRKHLLPMMYSRLHLISGVKILMQSIFTLFDIIPVSQM